MRPRFIHLVLSPLHYDSLQREWLHPSAAGKATAGLDNFYLKVEEDTTLILNSEGQTKHKLFFF